MVLLKVPLSPLFWDVINMNLKRLVHCSVVFLLSMGVKLFNITYTRSIQGTSLNQLAAGICQPSFLMTQALEMQGMGLILLTHGCPKAIIIMWKETQGKSWSSSWKSGWRAWEGGMLAGMEQPNAMGGHFLSRQLCPHWVTASQSTLSWTGKFRDVASDGQAMTEEMRTVYLDVL